MIGRRQLYLMAIAYSLLMAVVLGAGLVHGFGVIAIVFALSQVWFHVGQMSVHVIPKFNTPEYFEYLEQQAKKSTRTRGRYDDQVHS